MTEKAVPNTGELVAFRNEDKTSNDKRPTYHGLLKIPGETHERPFCLWAKRRSNGHILLYGNTHEDVDQHADDLFRTNDDTAPAAKALVAFNTSISVEPRDIVLFFNTHKTKSTPKRPTYLGYYNPGNTDALMRVAVWTRNSRKTRPHLAGTLTPEKPHQGNNAGMASYTCDPAQDPSPRHIPPPDQ